MNIPGRRLSLRSWRDAVEDTGFFAHTTIDLSLEGNVVLHLQEDQLDTIEHPLGLVRSRELVGARFLATKLGAFDRMLAVTTEHENASLDYPSDDASVPTIAEMSLPQGIADPASLAVDSQEPIVVSGVSIGLPQIDPSDSTRGAFSRDNIDRIMNGENFICSLTADDKQRILDQNVCQIVKTKDGQRHKVSLTAPEEVVQLCSKLGPLDLQKQYGVPAHVVECLDTTYKYAIAAGLEAMCDAGLPVVQFQDGSPRIVPLDQDLRDDTGVIFASSFPALDSCVQEVSRCVASRVRRELFESLQNKFSSTSESIESSSSDFGQDYEYDRKLLFKLLVMANCQLAELVKARGPNTQINSACASTTQAMTVAEDWIRTGRCRRVIVVSADNATSPALLPFLATGFLALGAATITSQVTEAAVPFDARRKGMILGSGAVGIVVETVSACLERHHQPKVEILGSHMANSAYHGCLMHGDHIASEFGVFLKKMELQHGLDRAALARDCVYFAHETCTSANGGCAKMELDALHRSFGPDAVNILVTNTKGFTGHPMAAGLEEAIAVESLVRQRLPPIANYKEHDPQLPSVTLAINGGSHSRSFALRFAAGFGSQFVYVLYRKWK